MVCGTKKYEKPVSLQVGDKIIEKVKTRSHKRWAKSSLFGMEKSRKIEILELNRHDLSPVKSADLQKNKTFSFLFPNAKDLICIGIRRKKI